VYLDSIAGKRNNIGTTRYADDCDAFILADEVEDAVLGFEEVKFIMRDPLVPKDGPEIAARWCS